MGLQLFLLHGAPATGKLTVAKSLSSLTGLPLVDNHAAIDVARMVFGFAAPGFWDMVHDLRVTTLRGAARANVPGLITTAAYSDPVDDELVQDYEDAIGAFGGTLCPVFLSCSEQSLISRVTSQDRVERGKLATVEGLTRYISRNNFAPIKRANCLELSTEVAPPDETALAIAKHFAIEVTKRAQD